MTRTPAILRDVKSATLPDGITALLEVAAGEADAVAEACRQFGQSAESLEEAASFFIEQVLFDQEADSYRVLGSAPDAPYADLRRHMGLIAKWLHPDKRRHAHGFDRTVFVTRLTTAWNSLKTIERRASYDALHQKPEVPAGGVTSTKRRRKSRWRKTAVEAPLDARSNGAKFGPAASTDAKQKHRRRVRRLTMFRVPGESVLTRLLKLLQGRHD
jgi:hypothetical protein